LTWEARTFRAQKTEIRIMKRSIALAAAAAATLLTATAAHAGGVNWSVGISLPPVATVVSHGPVYAPAPYYGAPAYYPEPVYYPAPAPAYSYYPAPVYYAPRVYTPRPRIWVAPRPHYHGGHWRGHGRGHDKHHHRQRSDWRR
jgi:hypothetical protein